MVFLQSRETVLISNWKRRCPRPMVQMKPVTQLAGGGEGAIPYCWSWLLDFLFLAPLRAHCTMHCDLKLSELPSDHLEATITK